ncbi:MAG: DNA replication and repair protein RecF, partial [Candidatus Peregrinibacteria bacterium]
GKGKTNFLEAIYILSLGKSFRTVLHEDIIGWKTGYMRCRGEILIDNETSVLDVFCSAAPDSKRVLAKNDVKMKNSEYFGNLLTVLFHPEDLNMLYLSPSYRRRYMDILLAQTDKKYLYALSKYKKVLKQRNALLAEIRIQKKQSLREDLDAWDTEILEYGPYILEKRKELVDFLNGALEEIYGSISGNDEKVKTTYKNSIKDDYEKSLADKREADIAYAKTSLGPHLDDLTFYINNREISSSASRGEFRTLLLAIKLAEIRYIKQKTNSYPVLLLDDVFSELDRKRQHHLLKSIKNCQTIITTTDIASLGELTDKSPSIEFVNLG